MLTFSQKELLEMYMDCLFTYEKELMVYVNEPWGSTALAPRLLVGRTIDGEMEETSSLRSQVATSNREKWKGWEEIFTLCLYGTGDCHAIGCAEE